MSSGRFWLSATSVAAAGARPHRHFAPPTGGRPEDPGEPPPPGEQTVTYTEDATTDFPNPERGWYVESSPGSFGSAALPSPTAGVAGEPTLELYFVRLDGYNRTNLTASLLNGVVSNLQQARTSGRKLALRFGYNRPNRTEAQNPEDYPDQNSDTSLAWMQTHVNQIVNYQGASPIGVNILDEYQDVIAVLQGGFIGRWGEQDSSALNSDSPGKSQSGRNAFFQHLMARTPADMMVQWRDPAYYQMDPANYPTPLGTDDRFTGSQQARVGHYNDCYLAGYEMVTYWNNDNGYTTEQQLQYTYDTGPFVAMGGETCDAYGYPNFNEGDYAITMMGNQAWDYLNSGYWIDLYSNWAGTGHLAEISRRMGYRIALVEANLPTSVAAGASMDVTLTFKNAGFGKVYNARPIDVVFVGPGGPFTMRLTADARRSLPLGGQTVTNTWTGTAPAGLQDGQSYSLYLRLPDPSPNLANDVRYALRLANSGNVWDGATGRHNLGASVTVGSGAGGGGTELYSLAGDPNFDRLALDNTTQDQNGMTLRDWYDHLYAAATYRDPGTGLGHYDSEFDSPDLRSANRQGNMFVGSMLMGLRLLGDLKLLDEAIRLAELWYGNMVLDGSGYLHLPGTDDQGLDTNQQAGLYARVMLAAHENRALTSPAGYDYGAIADKYKTWLTDDFLMRELERQQATLGGPSAILHDYIGWHHDGGAIAVVMHAVTKMGGGGVWSLAQWEAERDWFYDYYFAATQEGVGNEGYQGRTTRVLRFTIYPDSTNPDSYSLMYTTYVRYMISYLTELWCEQAANTYLTDTWLTQIAGSFADFVIDDTFSSNSLARTLGGDDPPNGERYGIEYNGTYRPRVSPADERWQDSAYCYLEGWDARGRIEDWGVQAWTTAGSIRDAETNYAAARILTQVHHGGWNVEAPITELVGVGSASNSETLWPKTGPVTSGDWFVDPNAVSNGNGSFESPFDNLHSALAAASADDLILIREGTLTPLTHYNTSTPGLRVFGYGAERPVIDASQLSTSGSDPLPIYITGDDQHWKRLHVIGVKDSNTTWGVGGVRIQNANRVKLEDIYYSDSFAGGFYLYGSNDCIVQDCRYWNVNMAGGTNVDDGYVTTGSGDRNVFTRNFSAYAPDDGFDAFTGVNHIWRDNVTWRSGYLPGTTTATGGDGNGFKCGGDNVDSGGNLVQGNLALHDAYVGINANTPGPGNDYLGNTVAYSHASIWAGFVTHTNADAVHDNVSVFNDGDPWDNSGVAGTNNTWTLGITDPLFADVANHDYSLAAGSPCIDAGVSGGHVSASEIALRIAKEWIPIAEAAA